MKENAKVIIRVRPLLKFEDEPAWIIANNSIKCMHSKAVKSKLTKSINTITDIDLQNYQFSFDRIVEETLSSQKIYKVQIKKMIEKSLISQRNCTIVAYGQTCSGKTYTLLGVKQAPGFIPCIMRDLFAPSLEGKYSFSISYTQIYNERLIDLLNPNTKQLKIAKDSKWGLDVSESIKIKVQSFEDCIEVLDRGEAMRKYGEKINHERSSRSHTILKIYVELRKPNLQFQRSVINIVDLAGSERLCLAEQGNFDQTKHINKSLFQFSNVLSKLSQDPNQHIPYRDSKLTRILQPSLSKNCCLAVIFCISPAVMNLNESISSLRLAKKTKKVEIESMTYQSEQSKTIKRLGQIIKQQQKKIKALEQEKGTIEKKLRDAVKKIQECANKESKVSFDGKTKSNNEKITSQPTSLNLKQANTQIFVLFDIENFHLSINQSIIQLDSSEINQLKAKFREKLSLVYEQYLKEIVRVGTNLGYDPSWLAIQRMFFSQLILGHGLNQQKISFLTNIISSLQEGQDEFMKLIRKHIDLLEKQARSQNLPSPRTNQVADRSGHMLQISSIEGETSNKPQGNRLLSWGSKKQSRVFKSEHENQIISEKKGLGNLQSIACGAHHTLTLNDKGEVFGWGKNQHYQIVSSKRQVVPFPKLISAKLFIKSIAAGWAHSLLLTSEGIAYTFGFGEDGQLGLGDIKQANEPTKLDFDQKIEQIYAGHSHSGFIDKNGFYYSFGFNKDYRLMISQSKQVRQPRKVPLRGIKKVALGVSHSCLLSKDGRIYCGGVGTNGQLGVELSTSHIAYETISVPQKNGQASACEKICPIVEVDFFSFARIIDISCGQCSTAVITEDYDLYTFGKPSFDRLGHAQTKIEKILTNVHRVELGYRHGFAWNKQSKQVYGWGFNMYNQVGTLSAKDIKTPQLIQSVGQNVIQLSAGFFHSAGISK